ncbi:Dihydrofolate reductase [Micrococcales bacterium KH10]|nr:Dihydrofolate reductase [Micrococcales bacterium KH10]
MGKLIVWNIVSLDGYFQGRQPWDLRLHEYIWGEDLRQLSLSFRDDLGLLVFGRVTYEGMAAHWQDSTEDSEIAEYMNNTAKLVASHTLKHATWQNTEVTADIVTELKRRKRADSRNIYVFGSAWLTHTLLQAGLVDELLIGIAPVILGAGTPLLKPTSVPRELQLLETRAIDTGGVLIKYAVPSS